MIFADHVKNLDGRRHLDLLHGHVCPTSVLVTRQIASRMRNFPFKDGISESQSDDWNIHRIFQLLSLRNHINHGRRLRFSDLVKEFSNYDSIKQVDHTSDSPTGLNLAVELNFTKPT